MYGYPSLASQRPMTGNAGMVLNSPAYPAVGGLPTMTDIKAWMDKTGPLNVQNKWWALGGALALGAGLYYYTRDRY